MFFHNFKYALKTLMKNKALVFWTIAFPIILGTLFAIAFSNLESSNKTDVINIAVINNAELDKNQSFKNAIDSLSVENDENQIFNTRYIDEESARRLLLEDEIIGFVELTDDGRLKVYIESNGIEQTILKSVTEEIGAMSKIIDDLAKREIEGQLSAGNYEVDYEKIYSDIIGKVQNQKAEVIDKSSEHLSYTMIEFYTLIAMTCLFGGMLGAVTISQNLANMSSRGKRVAVSPAKKYILILSSALAGYSIQIVSLIILFIYTIFVLGADYGDNLPLIVLLAFAGSLTGLTLGIAVAAIFKTNENAKTGIITAITMTGCFFAGMMGPDIKYYIDKNFPVINAINPANLITDGFYALYYYGASSRYLIDLGGLLIMSILFGGVSCISLRRQKYGSL